MGEKVALLVSAWIETLQGFSFDHKSESHSSWVRGLKQSSGIRYTRFVDVALLVSTWIETGCYERRERSLYGRTPRECVDWNDKKNIWNN